MIFLTDFFFLFFLISVGVDLVSDGRGAFLHGTESRDSTDVDNPLCAGFGSRWSVLSSTTTRDGVRSREYSGREGASWMDLLLECFRAFFGSDAFLYMVFY